ncbi:DUF29 domain-containing protein [Enterovirga aerilata]|uniref:DUF29 domain-containing protein n=1 Tax=Enterovirga aerilata TaxID=2730920 RepID=A0A849I7H6_9HYPH|nr:DUF29 domain-containing protein [Enterovirga sp. DB1703]NNM72245.1 DUF29 domain-containing protein [Enterovirga sp. DB1703]
MSAKIARHLEGRSPSALYETDFYAWTVQQRAALEKASASELDWAALAEEIGDLENEVFNALRSSFRIILVHLLKWDHRPERRSRSWVASIRSHRQEVADILARSPSLRSRQDEAVEGAYRRARIEAAGEMDRPERSLPPSCPYSLDDILKRPVSWPDE